MINTKDFYDDLTVHQFDFFAGVPDSLLKEFCSCVSECCPKSHHIIAANEGNAVALACGYHISSGHYGVVYMQNSGLGNAVNPLLSLADAAVYNIPMLLLVGFRGEPGKPDEPQHLKQGAVTLSLLESIDIEYELLESDYTVQLKRVLAYIKKTGKPFTLVVQASLFDAFPGHKLTNSHTLSRETALETIVDYLPADDFLITTTGKTSRELFEIRERKQMEHSHDFLTVGSMGHTASLAYGISLGTEKTVTCIDGDGSFLMHMGSLAVIGSRPRSNFQYILINNGAHDSVGGQPTVAYDIDVKKILEGCGFARVNEIYTAEELALALISQRDHNTALIVYTNLESRKDLGRPTISPIRCKQDFCRALTGVECLTGLDEQERNIDEGVNL